MISWKHCLFLPCFVFHAYRILFYPGSFVHRSVYGNFLNTLEKTIHHPIEYVSYQPWNISAILDNTVYTPKGTILLAHSFGAYLSFMKAKQTPNISACIVFNAHFNQHHTQPYTSVNVKDFKIPILTVFGRNDRRLAPYHVISDIYECDSLNISNKHFLLTNSTHFSLFQDKEIPVDIVNFLFHLCSTKKHPLQNKLSNVTPDQKPPVIWNSLPNTKHYFGWIGYVGFLLAKSWTSMSGNHMYHHADGWVQYKTYGVDIAEYMASQGIDANITIWDVYRNGTGRKQFLDWFQRPMETDDTKTALHVLGIHFVGTNTTYFKFKERSYLPDGITV